MEKTIGILGGMGPLATADLFRKVTLLPDAASASITAGCSTKSPCKLMTSCPRSKFRARYML